MKNMAAPAFTLIELLVTLAVITLMMAMLLPAIQRVREETQFNLKMVRDHFDTLPDVMENFFKKLPNYSPAYSNELPFPKKGELKDSLAAGIYNSCESLSYIFANLYQLYMPYVSRWENKDFRTEPQKLKAWETNIV